MPADTWIACKLVLSCTGSAARSLRRRTSSRIAKAEFLLAVSESLTAAIDEQQIADQVCSFLVESSESGCRSLCATVMPGRRGPVRVRRGRLGAQKVTAPARRREPHRRRGADNGEPSSGFVDTLAASVTDRFDDLALVCVSISSGCSRRSVVRPGHGQQRIDVR